MNPSTSELLDSAIAFAALAHAGQRRKGDDLPYIVHPIEVMSILKVTINAPEDVLIAAVLHDTIEDTGVSYETIARRFSGAAPMVLEMTDVFTHEAYPQMNRKARKDAERKRLAGVSANGQSIKVADLISNAGSIVRYDQGFARVFLNEKSLLLDALTLADPRLLDLARQVLYQAERALVQLELEKKHVNPNPGGAPAG